MGATVITTEDLNEFKQTLLEDIKELIANQSGSAPRKWLRSLEVKKLLGISQSTLQNLRVNGTMPYTRIGGVLYYDYEEIMQLLEENRTRNNF